MWHSHLNVWKFLKQKVLFPKGLNWLQHRVSRIRGINKVCYGQGEGGEQSHVQ